MQCVEAILVCLILSCTFSYPLTLFLFDKLYHLFQLLFLCTVYGTSFSFLPVFILCFEASFFIFKEHSAQNILLCTWLNIHYHFFFPFFISSFLLSSFIQTRSLQDKEIELRSQIKALDKEGAAHVREIKTRDTTIEDKEKVSN